MRKSLLWLAVPTLALVLAVAAVAFVPGILNAPRSDLTATSIPAPSWAVGDKWTYNVSLASTDQGELLPQEMTMQPAVPAEAFLLGTLTETVSGSVSTPYGAAWNVTLDGTFGSAPPRPIIFGTPTTQSVTGPTVTLTGYAWLRQSDLAPIYTLKSVHMEKNWTFTYNSTWYAGMMGNATYTFAFDATTQVWYAPALAIWQFPLEENTSWNVTSNATVHYASSFSVTGPNVTFSASHAANFTVPLRFSEHTGFFENVTTPAGTFRALPISASRASMRLQSSDPDANAVMNFTDASDLELPHPIATAWMSAQTGNVVKATFWTSLIDGPRIEVDLVSYTFG